MQNVTCTSLNMDVDVFNTALRKLSTERYIEGLDIFSADNDGFYAVSTENVYLTIDGIEYIEKNFGIKKELTSSDKIYCCKMRSVRVASIKSCGCKRFCAHKRCILKIQIKRLSTSL